MEAKQPPNRHAGRFTISIVLATLAVTTMMVALRTETCAQTGSTSVGLVSNRPVVDDQGFVWMSHQGLLRAETELGVNGTLYTSTNSAQYQPNLQQCSDDGNDLCISVGFEMADATLSAAQANTNTHFAIVDFSWDSYPDNLRGIVFAADEAGYLAGTLAGLMTDSDLIGVIGGAPIPRVDQFVAGYRNGAQCLSPSVTVLVNYAYDFESPALGAELAQDMIGQGADVIFAPAGPTGAGAVLTATQSGVWGIGVDSDFYVTVFESGTVNGSEKLLTSAMKRADNVVFDTIEDVVSDTFTPGTALYDLEADGVGLAPFHDADPYVSQSVRDTLQDVEQGIIDGTIDVQHPCRSFVYLPLTIRNY